MNKMFLALMVSAWTGAVCAEPLMPVLDKKASPGVLVLQTLPEAPAEKAGIRPADYVAALGEKPVGTCVELVTAAKELVGSTQVTISRAGKIHKLAITLDEGAAGKPRLGIRCLPPGSAEAAIFVGGTAVVANVEVSAGITMARISFINNSGKTVQVSPATVMLADGHRTMLKRLDNAAVTALLGGQSGPTPSEAPAANTASANPIAQSVFSFMLSRAGLDATTAGIASELIQGAALQANRPAAPVASAAASGNINRAAVDQMVLPTQELEPGYAVEGLVFFEAATIQPITVMINLNGQKATIKFEGFAKQ